MSGRERDSFLFALDPMTLDLGFWSVSFVLFGSRCRRRSPCSLDLEPWEIWSPKYSNGDWDQPIRKALRSQDARRLWT